MNIVNDKSAMLTNFEVFRFLKELQAGNNAHIKLGNDIKNLTNIANDTVSYLDNTVCKSQSVDYLSEIMGNLRRFNLTKAETLQIINNHPQSAVEVQLIVEECEERMTAEDIDDLIAVISKSLK